MLSLMLFLMLQPTNIFNPLDPLHWIYGAIIVVLWVLITFFVVWLILKIAEIYRTRGWSKPD